MSPLRSIPALAVNLLSPSGAYVPCWKTAGAAAGSRISYQRTPAWSVPSASTVWFTTSDSWSPRLRYVSGYIRR